MIYLEKIVFVLGGWVSTSDLLPQIEPQNQWCGSGFVDPDLYNKSRIRIRMERYESRTLTVDVQKHVKADIQISFLIWTYSCIFRISFNIHDFFSFLFWKVQFFGKKLVGFFPWICIENFQMRIWIRMENFRIQDPYSIIIHMDPHHC